MKFLKALRIGFRILKAVRKAEQQGIIPPVKVKGLPLEAIDDAATALVKNLKKQREG